MQYLEMTDQSLVLLMKEGESDAFNSIYRRYWRQLYGFAYQQLGVREEAEEIVHDLMLSLWQNREHSDIRNLNIYLFIAARNLVNKRIKAQMNLRKYLEYQVWQEVSESAPANELLNKEELETAIDQAMKRMPEKTATVFRMSKLDNLPVKKIAAQLGLTDKAVEYHITKSIKMLRRHLTDFYRDN